MRALVVGTGFGCRIHVPALRAAGFEVAGLVGRNLPRLEEKAAAAGIAGVFTDLDRAIAETGAGVVTVATTPATHGALTLQAIARGCHVLCEKPFAADAAEACRLVAAAEQAGVVNAVAHEFRWLPERALFGRAIAQGMIGEPRFLALDQFVPFCADPQARLPGWWFDKASGGGWLGAAGSHLIDQLRTWLGDIGAVSARLFVVSSRGDVAEDSYSARFTLGNGVEASMQQTAGAWGAPAVMCRCAGTRGSVWIEGGRVHLADAAGTRELPVRDDLALPPPPPAADPASSGRLSHLELGPFTRLCEAFAAAIAGSAARSPVALPTFRDGLATMAVMDAMRASSAQGGALTPVG